MVPERTQARANPARGLALIATAVVVGFFLLRNGWNQNAPTAATDAVEEAAAPDGAAPPAEGAQPTASTAPPRTPDQITVQVLNASGVTGAANGQTTELADAGYVTAEAGNAPEGSDAATTMVVFVEGFDREAATLATQIGAAADQVRPVADVPGLDPAAAQLFVVLGTDLAEGG
jgi:hypothetical protein